MLPAKTFTGDKQKPSARAMEQIQAQGCSTSSSCLSQAEVSSSRCSVLCTQGCLQVQSQLQHTALIPCPLPKPAVKVFKSPGLAGVLLSVGNHPLIHLSKH